jgi:hypothetical protein
MSPTSHGRGAGAIARLRAGSENRFAVTIRYEDMELTLIDAQTVAEMMEKGRAWVERQIYEPK